MYTHLFETKEQVFKKLDNKSLENSFRKIRGVNRTALKGVLEISTRRICSCLDRNPCRYIPVPGIDGRNGRKILYQ